MNIDELLRKYFDGETTTKEEEEIRTFFASNRPPEHLQMYQPIFAYFDREIQAKNTPRIARTKFYYLAAAVAASVALLLGMWHTFRPADTQELCLCSANYVVINGHCYTDTQKARSLALEALKEVAAPDEVSFPGIGSFYNEE